MKICVEKGTVEMIIKSTLLLLLAVPVLACDQGCGPYQLTPNHIIPCSCDERALTGQGSSQPSDEKPRRGQVPEWQDGTVHASVSKPVEIPETADNHKGDLVPEDTK